MTFVRITLLLLFTASFALAQNGFITLENDSTFTGFLRYHRNANNGELEIEFWRTKRDKDPRRFNLRDVHEYAIGKDTFRILRNVQPFPSEDFHIELAEAKVLERGRIELLRMPNPHHRSAMIAVPVPGGAVIVTYTPGDLSNQENIFILHHPGKNLLRGVPEKKKGFEEAVTDFFSEAALESYTKQNGKPTYRTLRKLVRYYNEKTRKAPQ